MNDFKMQHTMNTRTSLTAFCAVATIIFAGCSSPPISIGVPIVSTPPGAAIRVDKIPKGVTPNNVTMLLNGNHHVELSLEGYQLYATDLVSSSNAANANAGMIPDMLFSSPLGAIANRASAPKNMLHPTKVIAVLVKTDAPASATIRKKQP